jgi:hypothetical protein
MGKKNCFVVKFVTSLAGNFLMHRCIKRATRNVDQKGEFWCFFILTAYAGHFLNWGLLKQVLL